MDGVHNAHVELFCKKISKSTDYMYNEGLMGD